MKCVVRKSALQPQVYFPGISVFAGYLQLLDKLLVSLKAGCECRFLSAPCYFHVYPVNRAGTEITQIVGTLIQ